MMAEAIGNLVLPVAQGDPSALARSTIRYVDIASVDRERKRITSAQALSASAAPSRARQIIRAHDVLVSTVRPNLNAVALVPNALDNEIASTGFCVLRTVPDRLDARYLFYFVQTQRFISEMTAVATGASYPAVSDADVCDAAIPLPSLADQQRISSKLDRADRLRRMRRYAVEMCDEVLPAVFEEMFGDLRTNQRRWDFQSLEEVADIVSGVAKGQKYGNKETVEVPYLRVANVQDGHLDLSEIKTIRALPEDVHHLRLQPGDVVMTEGGDFDKLGRGAIWLGGIEDCIHQNHIFRVRLNQEHVRPIFFSAFLRSPFAKSYFLRCSKKTTNLATINMTQLRATPLAVPPIAAQQQFASTISRLGRAISVQREALRQADHLFETLLHQAFGEAA